MAGTASAARPRPNLTVTTVSSHVRAAQIDTVATIRNRGAGRARPNKLGVYLSATSHLDATAIRLTPDARQHALNGMRGDRLHFVADVPSGASTSNAYVIVCADVVGVVHETSESDNCAAGIL